MCLNDRFTQLRRTVLLTAGLLLLIFSTVQKAVAQGAEPATRFLFVLRNPDPALRQLLFNKMAAAGGVPAADLFFPELGFIGLVGVFPQPVAIADNDPQVLVARDVLVYSSAGPLGTGWVKNQFLQPVGGPSCNDVPPVVYLIDTGITSTHADFVWPAGATPALTFAPGFSYAKNTPTGVPLPEYPDNHDHGTRVAGCLGGRSTGLLEALGGRAVVKSVAIFDTPSPGNILATWASQAINGILRATTDHKARRALPWLKNRASVLVFAHATRLVDGRFAALDSAIEKAWQAGMHVCLSAGNESVNAALVSPAGAGWGYTLPGSPPLVQRFWSGALPPGAALYQASPEFTVTGACDLINGIPQLWAQTNVNTPAAGAVDGFAPGANVPCPAAVGPPFAVGSGTSYSAGLAAAMLTWEAWMRPWASPAQARQWLNNSMTLQPGGWRKVETPVLPSGAGLTWADWIEQFYPLSLSTPAQRDPAGDPDGDGVPNFREYFAGGDPRFPDTGMDPEISVKITGGNFLVTARLNVAGHLPSPAQVTGVLEKSTDLATWTPFPTGGLVRILPGSINGDGCLHEMSGSVPVGQRMFVRMKFTYTP